MTSIKRPLAAAGAAAMLGLTLTACGGSDYPTDASAKEFCSSFVSAATVIGTVQGDQPNEAEWKKVQKAFESVGKVGTPKDISKDERKGFEVMVDTITGLDYADAKKSFGKGNVPGVSKDDEKAVNKFTDYAGKTCASAG